VTKVSDEKNEWDPSKSAEKIVKSSFNIGGLLGGLSGLIEKLGELAEAGEEISRSGEFKDANGGIRGVFGINVKTGLGDQGQTELKVEPFGNVGRHGVDHPEGKDVREPLVDIHEEEDYVLVLAELPGVAKENVKINVADNRLFLLAERGKTTYRKEVDLPQGCSGKQMTWECSNGILQARFV
jgi:HSP20 family protein